MFITKIRFLHYTKKQQRVTAEPAQSSDYHGEKAAAEKLYPQCFKECLCLPVVNRRPTMWCLVSVAIVRDLSVALKLLHTTTWSKSSLPTMTRQQQQQHGANCPVFVFIPTQAWPHITTWECHTELVNCPPDLRSVAVVKQPLSLAIC